MISETNTLTLEQIDHLYQAYKNTKGLQEITLALIESPNQINDSLPIICQMLCKTAQTLETVLK